MNKIEIVDNPQISIWLHPQQGIIYSSMKQFCYGVDYRDALMKGIAAMKAHKATKWLSDNRLAGAVPREDEEWGAKFWIPAARTAGWKHWALVLPEKVIGQISVKRLLEKYDNLGVNVRFFTDPDEAMRWLVAL
jgi:hypothetical protein